MDKYPKPGTPHPMPSKSVIMSWLRSLFSDLPNNIKIQQFGTGVMYARILNHYHGNPTLNKIAQHPKNQYEYANNLKHVQTALVQHEITIPFDVGKVTKCKFLENWTLINLFYKQFNCNQESVHQDIDNSISNHSNKLVLPVSRKLSNFSSHNVPSQKIENSRISIYQKQTHDFSNINSQYNDKMTTYLKNLAQSSLDFTNYMKQNISMNYPKKQKLSPRNFMFQNNQNAAIDRIKQILLKPAHDTQKIRQIKILLCLPLQEDYPIKLQQEQQQNNIQQLKKGIEVKNDSKYNIQSSNQSQERKFVCKSAPGKANRHLKR